MRQNGATSAPIFYCVSYEILCETRIKPGFFGNCLISLFPALGQLRASRWPLALSVTADAVPAPPRGEPSLASPFGGGAPLWGAERARRQRPPPMGCVEALASCPLSRLAATALPKGEPSLASPFGGGALVGGGEGSGKPSSRCATVREKRFAVSLAFSHALRAYKGKVVGLCPTTRKLFEKSLTKNF